MGKGLCGDLDPAAALTPYHSLHNIDPSLALPHPSASFGCPALDTMHLGCLADAQETMVGARQLSSASFSYMPPASSSLPARSSLAAMITAGSQLLPSTALAPLPPSHLPIDLIASASFMTSLGSSDCTSVSSSAYLTAMSSLISQHMQSSSDCSELEYIPPAHPFGPAQLAQSFTAQQRLPLDPAFSSPTSMLQGSMMELLNAATPLSLLYRNVILPDAPPTTLPDAPPLFANHSMPSSPSAHNNLAPGSSSSSELPRAATESEGSSDGHVVATPSDSSSSVASRENSSVLRGVEYDGYSKSAGDINSRICAMRQAPCKKVVLVPIDRVSKLNRGESPPTDAWAWRKYGQKPIKGSPYPRGYYRCSSSKGCSARKQVERSHSNPAMLVITYTSEHNHPWPAMLSCASSRSSSTPDCPSPQHKLAQEEASSSIPCQVAGSLFSSILDVSGIDAFDIEQVPPTLRSDLHEDEASYTLQRDVDLYLSRALSTEDDNLFKDLGELPDLPTIFSKRFSKENPIDEVGSQTDNHTGF